MTIARNKIVAALGPGVGSPRSDGACASVLTLPVCEPVQTEVIRTDERSAIERACALAAMTHELRTPLNAIIGFAQLLAAPGATPLTVRQRRYIAHIEESGHHLLSLINDVLELARVRDSRLPSENRPAEWGPLPTPQPDRSVEAAG